MIGAEIYAAVGSHEKKQLLVSFGVEEDHIFSSRDTSFAHGVRRITNGYGVDVVLNSLSGDSLCATWECIAPFGRFIEIGKADIVANSGLPMASFGKNVSFAAVDLRHLFSVRIEAVQELLRKTFSLLANGDLCYSCPRNIYPVLAIEKAFRFLQSGKSIGRVVISIQSSDIVTVRLLKKEYSAFALTLLTRNFSLRAGPGDSMKMRHT
jgi:NADPH:quinone reductase-like Zn-dependent oxidoreductase